jgi:hypothetical protein
MAYTSSPSPTITPYTKITTAYNQQIPITAPFNEETNDDTNNEETNDDTNNEETNDDTNNDEETPTQPFDGSFQSTMPFGAPTTKPPPKTTTRPPTKPTTRPPISTSQPNITEPPLEMSTYQQNINSLISRYSPYASSSKAESIRSSSIAATTMGPEQYPEIDKILEERDTTDARRTHLEESVRKWNESMNRILLYVTVAIFACLLLLIIYNYLYLPTTLFVIAVVAVIATAAIFSVRQYFDSINRWKMDYDVYNYSPPVLDTTDFNQEVPESQIGSSIFSGWCMDSTCCSAGTIWDPASGQCSVVLPMTPRR